MSPLPGSLTRRGASLHRLLMAGQWHPRTLEQPAPKPQAHLWRWGGNSTTWVPLLSSHSCFVSSLCPAGTLPNSGYQGGVRVSFFSVIYNYLLLNFLTRVYTKSSYNNEKKSMLQKNLFERSILKAVNPASAEDESDPGLIPGSGRSPGEGNGNPLQYSCLGNPMDRGAWWAMVHRVTKSQTRLKQLSTYINYFNCPVKHLNLNFVIQNL